MFAAVITGPPGAGKSSVLTALVDALSEDDIAHVAVEVETLVWTHPALTDEQPARHLQLNCELYRQAGHDLLVLAQTLETDADVAESLAHFIAVQSSSRRAPRRYCSFCRLKGAVRRSVRAARRPATILTELCVAAGQVPRRPTGGLQPPIARTASG